MTKLEIVQTLKIPKSYHPDMTDDQIFPAKINYIQNLTYCSDGLGVSHNVDFLKDPDFCQKLAFSLSHDGEVANHPLGHPIWRAYVAGWAAQQALRIEGDFVECGVDTGILSSFICQQIDFNNKDRDFYLLDSFEGMDMSLLTAEEQQADKDKQTYTIYKDHYKSQTDQTLAKLKSKISQFHNIHIIKGYIPGTLSQIKAEQIAYLSIDLNSVMPEMETIKYLWDRLPVGAVILLDDYTFLGHMPQLNAWNEFADTNQQQILSLWTGQGLIIKTDFKD